MKSRKNWYQEEDCIVIENAPAGITSAKNAGLTCFAVQTSLPEDI
jgi:beta-phosphoglucomutase-like phosphatase (HAD superfamily)